MPERAPRSVGARLRRAQGDTVEGVSRLQLPEAAARDHLARRDGHPERWSRRYDYSGEGYLVARHDSARGTTRFEHDAAHRLVAEHPPTGASRVFEHDAAGNLLANGGGYALYHPGNVLAEANGRRFEHDLRQAVCSDAWQGGFRRFHRDERDQLARVESYRAAPADDTAGATRWEALPDWTARYDALNRRVDKTVAGQTTVFYWDTDRLAAEVQSSGALRVYVYADALAMTPLLFVDYAHVDAVPESGAVYAVLGDHLGCPERVEDMTGQTVWSAVVAPYGAVHVTAGGGFHQPLRWPGHYYDAELGLQYNRFRTYSPELGRYLEPDPLGRAGGLENVYAYTHNPLRRVDTHGLNECPEAEAARKKAAAENGEEVRADEEREARAAVAGAERDQLAARMRIAAEFLRANGQRYDRASGNVVALTRDERKSVLACIDYSQPVQAGPPPSIPEQLGQWQAPGGQRGSFFAPPGTPPEALGIGSEGKAWNQAGQPVLPKQETGYSMSDADGPYLRSTASPADDTWSAPGTTQPAPGGGTQYYVPSGCDPSHPVEVL